MRNPVLLSWSGGKDAAWTLFALRQRQDVEVVGLVTTITEGYERIAMQGIRVDVRDRTVRAEPGLTWRELNDALALHGLATTGGVVSTTGIAGLTLGGGLG